MGLDTSHNCWHGAYSAFMRWREAIAHAAGLPPLRLMEGFYESPSSGISILYAGPEGEAYLKPLAKLLPIKWDCLKPSPLHILLNHSDCDGEIKWEDCAAIADELEKLVPLMGDQWKQDSTRQFADGLRGAATAKENVDFH